MDEFTIQYIETALWSSNDETTPQGGEPMDDNYPVSLEFIEIAIRDCDLFREYAGELLDEHDDDTQAAHDFWLTRNGHGAGFWDGDWPEGGDRLTALSKVFGETTLYIGDDGQVYSYEG